MDETESAPRTNPAAAGREARRSAILDAAIEVFIERGFAAAKIDDVARAVGLAKGTVYLYFDSKEALFEAAVRQQIIPVVATIEAAHDDHDGDVQSLLKAQLLTAYEHIVTPRPRSIMRCLIAEGARFPSLRRYYHETVITRVSGAFRRTIDLGVARGEFRNVDSDSLARVIMGPAVLGSVWTMLFDDIEPLDLDAHATAHIDQALLGLLTRS